MKLIVGLGNPGARYEKTRHNLGFRVVRALASESGIRFKKGDLFWRGEGSVEGEAVLLVLPQAYMNRSGLAVRQVLSETRAPLKDLLVVSDDLALPLGALRMRAAGSSGGHQGLESIIALVGSQSFPRLRLGIGPVPAGIVWEDFVLGKFTRQEESVMARVVPEAVGAVRLWIQQEEVV